MMGMRSWVVAWVVCFVGRVHGQLGVRGVGEDTRGPADAPTDQLAPDEHEEGRQGGRGGAVPEGGREGPEVLDEPWQWRPLNETYQGCFMEEQFVGTLMFVNLTQVMEIYELESVEYACFHMCLNKKPSSNYIAVSPAVGGGTDGCGCKDSLDSTTEVDGGDCDEILQHYRAYCGPCNWKCLNRAGLSTGFSMFFICLPLAAILRSAIFHYDV